MPAKLSKLSPFFGANEKLSKNGPVVLKPKCSVIGKRKQGGSRKKSRSLSQIKKRGGVQKKKAEANASIILKHCNHCPEVVREAIDKALKRFTIKKKLKNMRKAIIEVIINGSQAASAARKFSVSESTVRDYVRFAEEELEFLTAERDNKLVTTSENSNPRKANGTKASKTEKVARISSLGMMEAHVLIPDPNIFVTRKTGLLRFSFDVAQLVDSSKLFSPAEFIGGVLWRVGVVRNQNSIDLCLACENMLNLPLDVDFMVLLVGSKGVVRNKDSAQFNGLSQAWDFCNIISFDHFVDSNNGFIMNSNGGWKGTIQADIFYSEINSPIRTKFARPVQYAQGISNNCETLYLDPKLLIDNSAFLKKSLEAGESINLGNVTREDILQLVDFLQSGFDVMRITKSNVECLLKPAYKWEMKKVMDQCEKFLIGNCADFTNGQLLFYADQYGLSVLEKACIGRVNTLEDLKALKKEEIYTGLDDNIIRLLIENVE